MRWEFLIPIIAVAVWILSSLIRGAEQQRARRPRPEGDADARGDQPRRTPAEIDRFLKEVQRRRQQPGEAERRPDREPSDVPMAIPVEAVSPPPGSRRTPRTESARTTAERSSRRRSAEAPIAVPVVEAPPAPTSPWQDFAQVSAPAALPALPPIPSLLPQAGAPAASPQAAPAQQLLSLLRTPQSLATAVLLREVFAQPLSRRARG